MDRTYKRQRRNGYFDKLTFSKSEFGHSECSYATVSISTMDRLVNKKRSVNLAGTTHSESESHPHGANGSRMKRSRNQAHASHDDCMPAPVFVPSSYKEAALRKIQTDNEFSCSERPPSFLSPGDIPNDCEAALLYLHKWFPKLLFGGRLPAILLSTQLNSVLQESSISAIDSQLKSLVYANKIIAFPTFSGSIPCSSKFAQRSLSAATNQLIVFYEDFVGLQKHQKDPLFQNFITHVLPYQSTQDLNFVENSLPKPSMSEIIKQVDLLRLISKTKLTKLLNIKDENDLRRLVNAGYLGIHDHGSYCLSLPGAGEFTTTLEKGRKVILASIRKAKFGEILQQVRYL